MKCPACQSVTGGQSHCPSCGAHRVGYGGAASSSKSIDFDTEINLCDKMIERNNKVLQKLDRLSDDYGLVATRIQQWQRYKDHLKQAKRCCPRTAISFEDCAI